MIGVVFLIRSLDQGGTERQLSTLVRAMDKDRFDVTVITFYSGGHFEQELADASIRLVSLGKRGRWDVIRFLWRLRGELKRLNPAILHSYLVEPNLAAIFFKPLFRSIKVVWGIRAANMELENYDWFIRWNFRLQCFMSRFADLIIANSEAGRDYHVALGFPPRTCVVIHGGVDPDRYRPDPDAGKRIRTEWGVRDDMVLIGLIGRLDAIKDHSTFIKAAALISLERPDARFVCVGSGPATRAAELQGLADQLGIASRIIWAGPRDDMPAVYNALDLACSSSRGEGFPNAIAEAMACGVRCVVTDVGDSALLVGDTGIVVPRADPQGLAAAFVAGLKLRSTPNPRARVEEKFGRAQMVERTERVLADLAHRDLGETARI